ncbi:MAG: hypothetical protein ABI376_07965, partial [Caulobacteraceae bacterium]
GSAYYDHWLAALETLVTARGLATPAELAARKVAWTHAYEHTPHGRPVRLSQTPVTSADCVASTPYRPTGRA